MSKPLPLPADLLALERQRRAAHEKLTDFSTRVDSKRREMFPSPRELIERHQWPEEQLQELIRLLRTALDTAIAIRRHPVAQQALAEGCYQQTRRALREAVAAPERQP